MKNLILCLILSLGGCSMSSGGSPDLLPVVPTDMTIDELPTEPAPRWTVLESGTSAALYGIWGASREEMYVVGEGGTILISNDGTHFRKSDSGTDQPLFGVFGLDGAVYAYGYLGTLLRSVDHGTTWQPSTGLGAATLFGMGGTPGDLYLAGEAGTVLRSTDGIAWSAVQTVGSGSLYGVWSTPNETFVIGDQGLYRTRDKGVSWTVIGAAAGVKGRALWSPGSADLFVTTNAAILRTRDGGINWTGLVTIASNGFRGLVGFPEGELWAVLSSGYILNYNEGYTKLANAYQDRAPVALYGIWAPSLADLYVVGDRGLIQHH